MIIEVVKYIAIVAFCVSAVALLGAVINRSPWKEEKELLRRNNPENKNMPINTHTSRENYLIQKGVESLQSKSMVYLHKLGGNEKEVAESIKNRFLEEYKEELSKSVCISDDGGLLKIYLKPFEYKK